MNSPLEERMELVKPNDSRSITELIFDLKRQTTQLLRDEMRLAKAELVEKAQRVQNGAKLIAIGGVLAFVGLLALVAGMIALLALAVGSLWLSCLIVGLVLLVVGGILLASGRRWLERLAPQETANSLKQDVELFDKHIGRRGPEASHFDGGHEAVT
jgi:membrane protein implicated in regulation of membrane protease activity